MSTVPVQELIACFLAVSVRLSGLMLFAPVLGSLVVPPRVKAGLVVALSVLLMPIVARHGVEISPASWPLFVASEVLIGAGMGIGTRLVFDAVQMAGQVLSTQMGFSLINTMDPQTQVDSTVMALFHQTIATLIFLRLNVHIWLLNAVSNSFTLIPPGQAHISRVFTLSAVHACGSVFAMGLQIAAPALSATFLTDIVLGLLGRASPSMPLMLLGTPLKTMVALGILFVSLRYWPAMLERYFLHSLQLSNHLLLEAR